MSHKIGWGNIERGPKKPLTKCKYCCHRRYNASDPVCGRHFLTMSKTKLEYPRIHTYDSAGPLVTPDYAARHAHA